MIFFNNLVINRHSTENAPFLFNLASFRRKVLSLEEMSRVNSMYEKNDVDLFDGEESAFYESLVAEKQIIGKDVLENLDNMLYKSHMEKYSDYFNVTDLTIRIQLTQDCNMDCSYCYEKKYLKERKTMTTDMIDNIQAFYDMVSEKVGRMFNIHKINITGGEPLLNMETVRLINYTARKWKNAKLEVMTNGINILKYYNELPWDQIESVFVSLDGLPDVHLSRRFLVKADMGVYELIINGIKKLLNDKRKVVVSTILDKNNFNQHPLFIDSLKNDRLTNSPYLRLRTGVVCDFANELQIDPNFNDKHDVIKINEFINKSIGTNSAGMFPSMSVLNRLLSRRSNEFEEPKLYRCSACFFDSHLFSPNGYIYQCDCVVEEKAVVGSFYPEISLNDEFISRAFGTNPRIANDKCKPCAYKYVCLGGCLANAKAQDKDVLCGVFTDDEIMDNLTCKYPSA